MPASASSRPARSPPSCSEDQDEGPTGSGGFTRSSSVDRVTDNSDSEGGPMTTRPISRIVLAVAAAAATALAVAPAVSAGRGAPRQRRGPRQTAHAARRLQAPGRDLRGEPLLRQPLRLRGATSTASTSTASRTPRRRSTTQVAQDGTPYTCLPQNDVNLTSPAADEHLLRRCPRHRREPLREPAVLHRRLHPARGHDVPVGRVPRPNGCLKGTGEPGGCTRDIVHRFYQEQYQIDGGRQDRYTTGSDAVGLTQGHYDTTKLPIYSLPALARGPEVRHRRPLLPGGLRWLVPQPPVADRGPQPARHEPVARAGEPGPQLAARRERDADLLPAVHRRPDRSSTGS